MYCKKCGKYNAGEVDKCSYCGSTELTNERPFQYYQASDKKNVGILLSIFLGLIGLIIGLLIYQDGYERKTFMDGWLVGLGISVGIAVLIVLLVSCVTCSALGMYY